MPVMKPDMEADRIILVLLNFSELWAVAIGTSRSGYSFFTLLISMPFGKIKLVSSLGRFGHGLGLILVSFFGDNQFFSFSAYCTMFLFKKKIGKIEP